MSQKCTFVAEDGTPCQWTAIWRSDPPRCVRHRLDGGAKPRRFKLGNSVGVLGADTGFYKKCGMNPKNLEDELVHLIFKNMRLKQQITQTPSEDTDRLLHLFRLSHWNMTKLIKTLEELDWKAPDDVLDHLTLLLEREEQDRERALQQLGPKPSERTLVRAPAYWAIYGFIEEFMETYHYAPSYPEIKKALGLGSREAVYYWIKRLEEDGLIYREKKGQKRSLRLV